MSTVPLVHSRAQGAYAQTSGAPRTFEERQYQQQAIGDLRATGLDPVILYAPTGAGKTAIMCDITRRAIAKGRRVLFACDSTEIVEQTSATMEWWGIPHGIIQGGRTTRVRPWESVHIGTIQTLRNRELYAKDIVFADEAHLCRSTTWEKVLKHYTSTGAKLIGATATPCRLDGRGLGKFFRKIIYCPSISALTEMGYLVPFRMFAPGSPDTREVHTTAGDYNKGEIASLMDKPKLVGDAVEYYAKYARGRLAILAATGIEHSMHLRDAFRAAGLPAEHADGNTGREERKRVLSMPAPGVICQVSIAGKGWDRPEVSAAIDCCPTQSLTRWLQFVGRAIRTFNGKADAVLNDHAGNLARFGYPDEERAWSLDDRARANKTDEKLIRIATCRRCFGVFRPGPDICPHCGAEIEKQSRSVEEVAGELKEIIREKKMASIAEWRTKVAPDKRRLHYEKLRSVAVERGYKMAWSAMRFAAIYGEHPPKEWQDAPLVGVRPGFEDPEWQRVVQGVLGVSE